MYLLFMSERGEGNERRYILSKIYLLTLESFPWMRIKFCSPINIVHCSEDPGCDDDSMPTWYSITISISHLFLIINRFSNIYYCGIITFIVSSVNGFIYSFVGKQFKQTLNQMWKSLMMKKKTDDDLIRGEQTEIIATVRKHSWEVPQSFPRIVKQQDF